MNTPADPQCCADWPSPTPHREGCSMIHSSHRENHGPFSLDTHTLTTAEGLRVQVRILESRRVFGRIDLLVSPVAGSGQAWVRERRVRR